MTLFSLIITLCFIFSAGANPQDFVLALDADMKGRPRLSASEVREDLDFLKRAAVSGYIGPDLRAGLDSIPLRNTSSQDLCDELANQLSKIPNSHLGASLEFEICGEGRRPGRVGENIANDRWLLGTTGAGARRMNVLAIPLFWPRYDQRWQGFLNVVRQLRRNNRPFILDLRGNRGGDEALGREMARILLGFPEEVDLPNPIESLTYRQSPEAFALLGNQWTWSILRLQNAGQPVPQYMFTRRQEVLSWMERAQAGEFADPITISLGQVEVDQARVFRQRVYVLIDRECASACESTLQLLEKLPGRLLVGENTLGSVEFGELGRVVLPNSRITVNLSTMAVKFRDDREVERSGYAPDLPVRSGQDALATLINSL